MERVRGQRLDAHAADQQLDSRQRLALLARICDAVEHAHQKGIVHRDLKPGNILVDETGQPKILDFGVARATDSDLQATMHTQIGAIVGTLPYMSPEQVGADPAELDTRSDVYALGVILFELLSGRLPYDLKQKALPEAVRIIREDDPTRLTVVNRAFRGDVDTIVSKALSKEKSRRYQSAADLAADIRRYLDDEPIVARPSSTAYQFRKFAARNKALVGGLVAVFVVLVLGTLYSSMQAVKARRAEAKARAVNDFLKEMLSSVDPEQMKGRDITVRQVLDEAAKRVGNDSFAEHPEIESSVRETIGTTYRSLGHYAEAETQLRAALDAARTASGADSSDVASAMNSLALVLGNRDDTEGAERLFRDALEIWRREGMKADVAIGLNNLGWLLAGQGDVANATAMLRESVDIRRRLLDEDPSFLAAALDNLASIQTGEGESEEAEALYREALALRRKSLGNDHPIVALTLDNLGELLRIRGDLDAAEPLYREALAIERKILGNDHPDVAVTLNNLGLLLKTRGDLDAAEPLYRESLAIRRKAYDSEHPALISALSNLGNLLIDKGNAKDAEPLFLESLAVSRRALPARHPNIGWPLSGLGLCLIRQGRHTEAEPLLREALAIREERLPEGDWVIAATASLLGEALVGLKRFEEAEPLILRGYEGMKDDAAVPALRKREAAERVERLYAAWGKPERAHRQGPPSGQLPR
jgi:tetratricopeptide (TPR) repeat protein